MKNGRNEFHARVVVELAKAELTQRALAKMLKVRDTTLSDWLRGAHPGPADLAGQIESALRLKPGTLSSSA